MDIHRLERVTHGDVEKGHLSDLEAADRYGVRYLKYWFNEAHGHVFCLIEAPNRDAAVACHIGTPVPDTIIEVQAADIAGFLGAGPTTPLGAALSEDSTKAFDGGVRAILFTDIEGSTEILDRLGDAKMVELLHEHDAIIRVALSRWNGRQVKHTGDGVMAAFTTASSGVSCAIDIQSAFARREAPAGVKPVRLRIGLSAGEPVEDGADLFGTAVHLAARTCAQAKGGQILVSTAVAELCRGKNIAFVDYGDVALKGFAHPVRLHEVKWAPS
jgi:class 3 adenylate cyclase